MKRKWIMLVSGALCLCLLSGCGGETVDAPSDESESHSAPANERIETMTDVPATDESSEETEPDREPDSQRTQSSSKGSSTQTTTNPSNSNQSSEENVHPKVYGLGETWVVDGQWELTFTAATRHEFCNYFHDSNGYKEVVILTYSYKNINHPDDLMFTEVLNFQVFDSDGEISRGYPCTHCSMNGARACPAGTKCTDVQTALELKHTGDYITIRVSEYAKYGSSLEEESAIFNLKVTG